ncbi:PB1 domain-containing protein [Aphelenchoides besseyi]|nr:PB1 domain-containing protein [Aphelenchoides besseyi]KAI6208062.1 PB1 domain-containing protein [Aphelenchoides besseyi]
MAYSTILKAKYVVNGEEHVRKRQLHHHNDLTYNDLVLKVQSLFDIKPTTNILLKYKDEDNDLVTLADDDDLLLAITDQKNLYVLVSVDKPQTDTTAITDVERSTDVKTESVNSYAEPPRNPSPAKTEEIATIVPSHHEQVNAPYAPKAQSYQEQVNQQASYLPKPPLQQDQQNSTFAPKLPPSIPFNGPTSFAPPPSNNYSQWDQSNGQPISQPNAPPVSAPQPPHFAANDSSSVQSKAPESNFPHQPPGQYKLDNVSSNNTAANAPRPYFPGYAAPPPPPQVSSYAPFNPSVGQPMPPQSFPAPPTSYGQKSQPNQMPPMPTASYAPAGFSSVH